MKPTAPGTPLARTHADIAQVLDLRARRAVDHFTALTHGGPVKTCPICGYVGRFSPVRHKPAIWCPNCDSRPRHRLFALWLASDPSALKGARVLHFAAESALSALIRPRVAAYLTADIHDDYDLTIDITAMNGVADGTFDAVIANHVLEHVDDAAALAEMARILAPGGLAVLTVPLVEGWDKTLELPDASAEDRALRATDPDHLRMYGRDFADRIRAAGFDLTVFAATEPMVGDHALHRGEKIFLARKPAAPTN
ncbi:MAG: SAM-dependent methyltransferase [Paracoccaceae bacterium]|jgi:SAM-dependent methyltransferase